MSDCLTGDALDIRFLGNRQARVSRIIRVRREHRRPARAERSVGIQLNTANGQAITYLWTAPQILPPQWTVAPNHRVYAHGKFIPRDQHPIRVEILPPDS